MIKHLLYALVAMLAVTGTARADETIHMYNTMDNPGYVYCIFTDSTEVNGVKTYIATLTNKENSSTCEASYTGSYTIPTVILRDTLYGYNVWITKIGDYCFYNCTGLTGFEFQNTSINKSHVKEIGKYAFYNCSSLKSITLPDSVKSIGNLAFSYCDSLESITLPDSVTSIEDGAFMYCTSLTSIDFLDAMTSIEDSVFQGCTSLTSVTIPNSVTSIGKKAFKDCTALNTLTLPAQVTQSVYSNSFSGCDSLASVTISGSGEIGTWAFYSCKGLKSLTIGNSVTSIGRASFENCTSLDSLTIGNSVTSIVNNAFYFCKSLPSVTIPNSVDSIGDSAFGYCTSLTSIKIPDSVTKWGTWTFNNDSSLVDVTIGSGVKSIGEYTFYNCTSLEGFDIPDNVTSIGKAAFKACTSLDVMVIHEGITSIGEDCFDDCASLDTLWFYPKEPPFTSTTDKLTGAYAYLNIYVPTYSTDDYWASPTLYNYTAEAHVNRFGVADSICRIWPFEEVTVSSVGVGTLALPFRSVIASAWNNFNVYTLSNINNAGDTVYATQISSPVSTDTPVYIEASPGTYRVRAAVAQQTLPTDSTTTSSAGYLRGNYRTGQYAPVGSYVLQNQPEKDGLAFYKVYQENYSPLRQFSAYLVLDDETTTSSARNVTVIFDDNIQDTDDSETTGIANISGVNTATGDGNIYNLQGIRMNSGNLPKGIYIRNGKKFIVR